MVFATSPERFTSSMNSLRYFAPATRALVVPHGLLHAGDLAVEHARAGQLLRVAHQARLEPGQHVQLLLQKQLIRAVDALGAHQLGVLQGAAEIQVIGAARRHRDAHAFAVDIGDAA